MKIHTIGMAFAALFAFAVQQAAAQSSARLVNVSARAFVGQGEQVVIAGFVISGTGTMHVLIRGVGPSIQGKLGVNTALEDPLLAIYRREPNGSNTLVAQNDNWDGLQAMQATALRAGAFPLELGSKDAAIVAELAPGAYTAVLSGKNGTQGIGLVEAYDVTQTTRTARFANLSARVYASGNAANAAIVGFVLDGRGDKQLLIRGAGPSLIPLGVTAALPNPLLTVYNANGQPIVSNDNWSGSALSGAFANGGAFPFKEGALDAAILMPASVNGTVSYTAMVGSGAVDAGGIALAEMYDLQ